MNATDFSNLIRNNCHAATLAIEKKEIGFETVIGILESHKQALFDWRACQIAAQMRGPVIQRSTTMPPNPPPNGQ